MRRFLHVVLHPIVVAGCACGARDEHPRDEPRRAVAHRDDDSRPVACTHGHRERRRIHIADGRSSARASLARRARQANARSHGGTEGDRSTDRNAARSSADTAYGTSADRSRRVERQPVQALSAMRAGSDGEPSEGVSSGCATRDRPRCSLRHPPGRRGSSSSRTANRARAPRDPGCRPVQRCRLCNPRA